MKHLYHYQEAYILLSITCYNVFPEKNLHEPRLASHSPASGDASRRLAFFIREMPTPLVREPETLKEGGQWGQSPPPRKVGPCGPPLALYRWTSGHKHSCSSSPTFLTPHKCLLGSVLAQDPAGKGFLRNVIPP